jgi:hypothetical protein
MDARPTYRTPDVATDAAAHILAEMRKQCADLSTFSGAKPLNQLVQAITRATDAFDRALYLQGLGWPIDQRMVDLLHRRGGFEQACLDRAEQAWTVKTGTRFPCPEGGFVLIQIDTNYVIAKVIGVFRSRSRGMVRIVENQPKPVEELLITAEEVVKVIVGGVHENPVIRRRD